MPENKTTTQTLTELLTVLAGFLLVRRTIRQRYKSAARR